MATTCPTDNPWVTVVVPCRNRAAYLRPTIDSILAQDYPHVECMVVDAQSTDDTLDILRGYGERIRWVSEPDEGHADAINKGWRLGRGQVLAWLNADDVWSGSDTVSRIVAYLTEHPQVDVAYGDCGAIDERGEAIGYSYLRPWDLTYALLHCDNCIPQPAAFVRRRILDRVGYLDTAFHQKKDHELWLRIAVGGGCIVHVWGLVAHARAIRGLSFDGRTAAPACVQLTRHALRWANLPGPLQRWPLRRRAMSNAYLRGIDYARAAGGLRGLIARYAMMAMVWDSTNWRAVMGKVRWRGREKSTKPQAAGERSQAAWEEAWISLHLPSGPGEALVCEARESDLALAAALRGMRTTAIAPRHTRWPYQHPNLRFMGVRLDELDAPSGWFDLIVCRRGVTATDEAGLRRLGDLLKPGGTLLLTLDVTAAGGDATLPQNWPVRQSIAWRRNDAGRWIVCDASAAMWRGCVLEKPADGDDSTQPRR